MPFAGVCLSLAFFLLVKDVPRIGRISRTTIRGAIREVEVTVRVSAVWRNKPRKRHNDHMRRRIHNRSKNGCPNLDKEARCNVSLGAGLFCGGGEHCAAQAYETENAAVSRKDTHFKNDRRQSCAALAPSEAVVCRRELDHGIGRVTHRGAGGDAATRAARPRSRTSGMPGNPGYNARESAACAGD